MLGIPLFRVLKRQSHLAHCKGVDEYDLDGDGVLDIPWAVHDCFKWLEDRLEEIGAALPVL